MKLQEGKKRTEKSKLPVIIIGGKSPYTATGGYASYSRNIAKILTSRGYPVHLLTFADKQKVEKKSIATVHFVKTRFLNHLPLIRNIELAALPFYSLIFFNQLRTIFTQFRYQQVVVWGIGPWGLAGALLKILYKDRVILVTSNFTTFRHEMRGSLQAARVEDYGIPIKLKYVFVYYVIAQLYSLLSYFVIKQSQKIITHYKSTEDILTAEFGVNRAKFFRMSYFVELFKKEIHTPVSKRMQKLVLSKLPIIVSICRQDPRKGINYLLRALPIVQQQIDCTCIIVGAGILRDANIALAQKLKLKNVVFPGALSDIQELLQKAWVYVLPTVEEGSGALSIVEAMSQGVAIVTTDCDGLPEDIKNEHSGLLVPPHDSRALARALLRMLRDRTLAQRLGRNAQKTYQEKFAYSRMAVDIDRFMQIL